MCTESPDWKKRPLKNVSQRSTKKQKVVAIELAFNAHSLDGIVNFRITDNCQ